MTKTLMVRVFLALVLIHGLFGVGTAFAGGPDCTKHPENPNCQATQPPATEPPATQPPATNPPGACGPGQHDENGTCVPNGGGGGDEGNPCPPGQHEDNGACVPNGGGGGNGCQNQGNGNGEEDQGGGNVGCDTATPPPTEDPCIEDPESCVTPTEPPVVCDPPAELVNGECVTPTEPPVCTENCPTATPVPSETPVATGTPVVVTVEEENHPPKTGAGDLAGLGFAFAEIAGSAFALLGTRKRKIDIQFK